MSKFVNKYQMKYQDYNFPNNKCVSTTNIDTIQTNPSTLDQIEDVDFWNRSYNYTNLVNNNGETIGLKGVCNPILINNCEKVGNNNKGICNAEEYINGQPLNIPYRKYEVQGLSEKPFSFTENFKLDTDTEIINDPNFATLYCKSGSLKEENGKFLCS